MPEQLNISLELYLKENGVEKVKKFKNKDNKIKLEDVDYYMASRQLKNISRFHEASLGYFKCGETKLDSRIGREIEKCKVKVKKLKRSINNLKEYYPNNCFEELLLDNGDEYIRRSEECIHAIDNSDYISLVMRSMNRIEVCLGNTSFDNLGYEDGLKIVSLNNCSYNMVEQDAVYFLSKLKRKNADLNWNKLIGDYCKFEGLDENSKILISALLSYPYEFIKCFNRYKKNTKEWTVKQYYKKMQEAMIKDGESLIAF